MLDFGDGNHSVLRSFGNTLDEVPHVSLRESKAEGDDPITRPTSPEIPIHQPDSRYQLHGEIARGGMGVIIKGRDTDLGRDLAIKVLLECQQDNPEVVRRFVEEARRSVASCSIPGLCRFTNWASLLISDRSSA